MLSKGLDYIDNEYYVYNRRLCNLVGLWQYQISYKYLIYVCFIICMLLVVLYQQINALSMANKEIMSIAKLMETILPTVCFGSCYCNLLFNSAIMKKILNRIKCDWTDLVNKPELLILRKYAEMSKRFTINIAIWFYLYIVFLLGPTFLRIIKYSCGTINRTELILPVNVGRFTDNSLNYYLELSFQSVITFIVGTVGIANYSMFIAVVQHAVALLDVVEWRVNERFKNDSGMYGREDNVDDASYDENLWLIGIIKFYTRAIEFIDLMKLFYETVYVFEMFLALIFFMIDYFYIFQILSFNLNKIEELTAVVYIVASASVIYIYFYFAQKLIDQNNKVFMTFCQVPYYTLSLKTQRMLLFLIMKSTRLSGLSARGVIIMSHNLFVSFLRTSFSFTMVLHNLHDNM